MNQRSRSPKFRWLPNDAKLALLTKELAIKRRLEALKVRLGCEAVTSYIVIDLIIIDSITELIKLDNPR